MIGRAVQGRPWLPGQIARYLASGISVGAPSLGEQFNLIDALYDEMLNHHGSALGRRHARKHLGWALDSAAATIGAPIALLKHHRSRVLTAEEPKRARLLLAEAYDDFSTRAAA
jgi:tRNA-dihydrouridine synthase